MRCAVLDLEGGVDRTRAAREVERADLLVDAMYGTGFRGALEGDAKPGWSCAKADWTCEGGTTIGIAAYAQALGTTAVRSPNTTHAPYGAAPEPPAWLAAS